MINDKENEDYNWLKETVTMEMPITSPTMNVKEFDDYDDESDVYFSSDSEFEEGGEVPLYIPPPSIDFKVSNQQIPQ